MAGLKHPEPALRQLNQLLGNTFFNATVAFSPHTVGGKPLQYLNRGAGKSKVLYPPAARLGCEPRLGPKLSLKKKPSQLVYAAYKGLRDQPKAGLLAQQLCQAQLVLRKKSVKILKAEIAAFGQQVQITHQGQPVWVVKDLIER